MEITMLMLVAESNGGFTSIIKEQFQRNVSALLKSNFGKLRCIFY